MSLYLSGLPLWIAATLLVVIPTAIAMCGPVYIRHKVGLERLTTNNEIAGFKFATVGVIYAVLLAFAVIVVWERFSEAEGAVLQEAGAAATLYHLSAGADPDAAATRAALSNYLKLAIEKDWPSMANEQASAEVTKALNALYSATIRKGANGSTQSPVRWRRRLNSSMFSLKRDGRAFISPRASYPAYCGPFSSAAQF